MKVGISYYETLLSHWNSRVSSWSIMVISWYLPWIPCVLSRLSTHRLWICRCHIKFCNLKSFQFHRTIEFQSKSRSLALSIQLESDNGKKMMIIAFSMVIKSVSLGGVILQHSAVDVTDNSLFYQFSENCTSKGAIQFDLQKIASLCWNYNDASYSIPSMIINNEYSMIIAWA